MTARRRSRRKAPPTATPPAPEEGAGRQSGGLLRRMLASRQAAGSPFPPLTRTLARGAIAVGGSPLVLAVAFAGLLVLWGAFAALKVALSAEGMVYVMGVPPLHVPIDVGVIQSLLRTSSTGALGAVLALGVGRGLILGALAVLVLGAVRGRTELRESLRRLPRVAVAVFGIYGIEVALFLFLLVFMQAILGAAAALVMLVLGLHFLGFAPVVAAAEAVPAGAALRLGFRAARLPGARHVGLVLAYFVAVVYAGTGATATAGATAPATPSILTWGTALLATFVHTVMLAALAYRWDAIREVVLAEHNRREAERRSARGAGRGRRPAAGKPGEKRAAGTKASRSAEAGTRGDTRKRHTAKGRSKKGKRR